MNKVKLLSLFAIVMMMAAFSPAPGGYSIGDSVADFKLKNVDGKMVALSDYKSSKGVIVIFDCNTCPYSKKYNDRIIALNAKYKGKNFPVVAINPNDPTVSKGDSFEEMVALAKEKSYDFPYLVDESQNVAKQFGATNTPHVFVLKNDGGKFKVAYIGAIDDNPRDPSSVSTKYVEDAVDALMNGKSVSTESTKAIGCTIKWKS